MLIREFPEPLPRIVLHENYLRLLDLLPLASRSAVKPRIAPVDSQVSMLFPSSAAADDFLEAFRAADFVYRDQDSGVETRLVARKGRPLAIRRRGGVIHPIYAKTDEILKGKDFFRTARISQTHSTRGGLMKTELFAEVGRKVTPLFAIIFREAEHETTVSSVDFPATPVLSASECAAIRAAANLQ